MLQLLYPGNPLLLHLSPPSLNGLKQLQPWVQLHPPFPPSPSQGTSVARFLEWLNGLPPVEWLGASDNRGLLVGKGHSNTDMWSVLLGKCLRGGGGMEGPGGKRRRRGRGRVLYSLPFGGQFSSLSPLAPGCLSAL